MFIKHQNFSDQNWSYTSIIPSINLQGKKIKLLFKAYHTIITSKISTMLSAPQFEINTQTLHSTLLYFPLCPTQLKIHPKL